MVRVETNNPAWCVLRIAPFGGHAARSPKIAGHGTVGFSDCTFVQWDRNKEGRSAIQADSGTLLVNGCEFREDKPQIELGGQVRRAVISGNVFTGKPRLTNNGPHIQWLSATIPAIELNCHHRNRMNFLAAFAIQSETIRAT